MSRLKNKDEIENYEMKSRHLMENGWETWYSDDNWVKTEWIEQGLSYDRMGGSTDDIYHTLTHVDDLVEVRELDRVKGYRYRNWTTVTRFLATGLQGVEIREIQ